MVDRSAGQKNELGRAAEQLKNKSAVQQLLRSEDTKRMMDMLNRQGEIQGAARAAAAGDPSQLMSMMQQLMHTQEGAKLVEKITRQAQQSGL